MDRKEFERYKNILDKYKYPYSGDEEVFEVIANIRSLAQVILSFEEKRNKAKDYDKRKSIESKV